MTEQTAGNIGPEIQDAVRELVRAAAAYFSETLQHQTALLESEARWERGSDGNFRQNTTSRRRFPLLSADEPFRSLPQYGHCVELLRADLVIGVHLGRLVGTANSGMQLQAENVLWSLFYAMVDDNGAVRFDDERFDKEWQSLVEFFTTDQVAYKTVAPLPYLVVPHPPLKINAELELDSLTENEITRCCQVGVLAPVSSRVSIISAAEAVGIRATRMVPKVVYTDDAFTAPAATEDVGSFGNRPHLNAHLVVDDVLSALRLFKHSRIRVAGHASWSESWWLRGGTAYRCLRRWPWGAPYELTDQEVPRFLELWRRLEKSAAEFEFSIRRFNVAFDRDLLEDQIVDLVIAAESLFLGELDVQDRGELRFRFALRAAKFIDHQSYGQREIYKIMRRAYDARSSVVHGGSPEDTRLPNNEHAKLQEFTEQVEELVRVALQKALSMKEAGKSLRRSEFWEDLVFKAP